MTFGRRPVELEVAEAGRMRDSAEDRHVPVATLRRFYPHEYCVLCHQEIAVRLREAAGEEVDNHDYVTSRRA
jgi:hypothetical protein